MGMHRSRKLELATVIASLMLAIGFFGCAPIQTVAPYDQKIDEGIMSLQKATEDFFIGLERKGDGTPIKDYYTGTDHIKFYDSVKVTLSGLQLRAGVVARNVDTTKQLDQLRQKFQILEDHDRTEGFTRDYIITQEKDFNKVFSLILMGEIAKKPSSGSKSDSESGGSNK